MTDRMRKALELIASGVGPLGARLGYDQMREIAQAELTVLAAHDGGYRKAMERVYDECVKLQGSQESAESLRGKIQGIAVIAGKALRQSAIPQDLEARLPGYTAPEPEMPLPPMMVRDLL